VGAAAAAAAASSRRRHSRVPRDFDVMFERLAEYREVHGMCTVSKNCKEDAQVSEEMRLCVCDISPE
jgi:hypothetical protein